MFPKANRFPTRLKGDFFARAEKKFSPLLILYYQPNQEKKCRAAVVVPKRVIAKAAGRSQAKRWLRNALIPHLPTLEGYDVVLYVKSWKLQTSFTKIASELEELVVAAQLG